MSCTSTPTIENSINLLNKDRKNMSRITKKTSSNQARKPAMQGDLASTVSNRLKLNPDQSDTTFGRSDNDMTSDSNQIEFAKLFNIAVFLHDSSI